jgi:DNA polymerase III delta subunit
MTDESNDSTALPAQQRTSTAIAAAAPIASAAPPSAEALEDAKIDAWFQKWFHGHGAHLTIELYNWFFEKRAEMYAEFKKL